MNVQFAIQPQEISNASERTIRDANTTRFLTRTNVQFAVSTEYFTLERYAVRVTVRRGGGDGIS